MVHKQPTSSPQNVPSTVSAYWGSATTALEQIFSKKWLYWDMNYRHLKERIFCLQSMYGTWGKARSPGPREISDTYACGMAESLWLKWQWVTINHFCPKRDIRRKESLDSTYFEWCENKSQPLLGDAFDGVPTAASAKLQSIPQHLSKLMESQPLGDFP